MLHWNYFFSVVLFDHQNTDIVWDIVCVYLYLSYFLSSTAHTHLKNRQKIKQHIQHQNFDVKKTFLFFC